MKSVISQLLQTINDTLCLAGEGAWPIVESAVETLRTTLIYSGLSGDDGLPAQPRYNHERPRYFSEICCAAISLAGEQGFQVLDFDASLFVDARTDYLSD